MKRLRLLHFRFALSNTLRDIFAAWAVHVKGGVGYNMTANHLIRRVGGVDAQVRALMLVRCVGRDTVLMVFL